MGLLHSLLSTKNSLILRLERTRDQEKIEVEEVEEEEEVIEEEVAEVEEEAEVAPEEDQEVEVVPPEPHELTASLTNRLDSIKLVKLLLNYQLIEKVTFKTKTLIIS